MTMQRKAVTAIGGALLLCAQPVAAAGTAFVQLFEWKWTDIAAECERWLGPKGFEAVLVSPPNEHVSDGRWWARYQPVSYQLASRSGSDAEFREMVQRCSSAGVRIYVDAVVNHTALLNNGGTGSGGTRWSVRNHPGLYGAQDYHTPCAISNYGDAGNVQYCALSGLPDLNTGADYVQGRIAGYLNYLKSIGVAGFRIDAAKHMSPADLSGIFSRAANPYNFMEVIGAPGEAVQPGQYVSLGLVTEFKYGKDVGYHFARGQVKSLRTLGPSWGYLPSDRAVVFIDNHDTQRGGAGGSEITYKNGSRYNLATVFMLAWPFGYPQLMSSYRFSDFDTGPPGAGPANCTNEAWVCEHRWGNIANMVGFRNATIENFYISNWWDNGNNQIAFGRGEKGFVVINNEGGTLTRPLQTGMAPGTYCNVMTGDFDGRSCTGPTLTVNANGFANFSVPGFTAAAIHVAAKLAGAGGGGGGSGGGVAVEFTCLNGTTYWGQSVYVVGNQPALGNWAPAAAIKLNPTAYPSWSGTIELPANSSIEWKCIKREEASPGQGIVWQGGGNNAFATPASGSAAQTGAF